MNQSGTLSEEVALLGGTEPSWAELLGCNNWNGLLDPLNHRLRQLILRCGDLCEAAYDAFVSDERSKYAGSSRYGKKDFFDKVMLDSAADYQVESFIYATADGIMPKSAFVISRALYPWDKVSNFMGYIATTTDEVSRRLGRREIYIVWRGTVATSEWKNELCHCYPKSAEKVLSSNDDHVDGGCCCCSSKVNVMGGWLRIYLSSKPESHFVKYSARLQLHKKIEELRETYKNENLSIIVTGHSLGASLSVLSAFDLVENKVRDIPVSAIVFACPKVGNNAFRKRANSHPNLKILHIKNTHDLVPKVPPFFWGYVDTGIILEIDNYNSPYLKKRCKAADWHNLEATLHVIDGWNGKKGKFLLNGTRSRALVNKTSDILIDREAIPDLWWVEKNKGMARGDDGKWICAPPSEGDQPVPEFDI